MLAVIVVFSHSFLRMASLWEKSAYAHGFFAIPVSLWLVWRRREDLAKNGLTGSWIGLLSVGLLVGAWLVFRVSALQALEHIVAALMVPALVLTFFGWAAFKEILFPLFFVVMAVPFGEEITPYLVEGTADVSEVLLRWFGVPSLRDGPYFTLPGGSYYIADGCSGFKNLTAGMFVALLGAYLLFRSWPKRVFFVAVVAVSFVVVNGIRAFLTMLISSASGGRLMAGQDHILLGWVIFAVLMLTVVLVGSRYADPDEIITANRVAVTEKGTGLVRASSIGLAAVAVLLLGQVWSRLVVEPRPVDVGDISLPAISGCTGPKPWVLPWAPHVTGADSEMAGSYECDGYRLHLFWAAFANPQQGRELIGFGTKLIPASAGRIVPAGTDVFQNQDGHFVRTNQTKVIARTYDALVWHWYAVNGVPVRLRGVVKIREAIATLRRQSVVSSVNFVVVSDSQGTTEAFRPVAEKGAQSLSAVVDGISRTRE
jgi:exosortase